MTALKNEFRPMLRLAAPLALAELGWMAMGAVDTIMAGPLGAAAIGAGSLGGMLFYPIVVAATGVLLGMDTLVAQSFGADDPVDCRRTLVDGIWLATVLAPVLGAVVWALIPAMRAAAINPRVLHLFTPYLKALLWGIPPLLYFTALRRYLQAVDIVKPVTFTLVSANIINFVGNYALMYGHWGFPKLGLEGSGYSTSVSRAYMAAVLLGAVVWSERRSGSPILRISWRPHLARLRRLVALGFPAAGQLLVEGAVFGLVSVFAARLEEHALAAHGIAVNVIATTYMVPLGISSAAAVRVGQAVGRKDPRAAAASGWSAVAMGALFMAAAGVALWAVPRWIIRIYTRDAAVVALGAVLLRIAAFFELFDGLQTVITGALRGLGETRTPMLAHFLGYWVVGLPLAYALCFSLGWGAPGIWIGLCAALILVGSILLAAWLRKSTAGGRLSPPVVFGSQRTDGENRPPAVQPQKDHETLE
ncbi:MAG: MATE family efflux transporter [Acidobacteriia bacterium]|nr:MATE family efflux transporter [Terriglobia bacterium]